MRVFRLISVALVPLLGCTDEPLPSPTVTPPGMLPDAPGTLPDLRFSRPPPRDMAIDAATDASADATLDAASLDAEVVDAQPTDAAIDMAGLSCQDDPCVLAVELDACEACPIALPTSVVADRRCTVVFDQATPLFEYVPFECTGQCAPDTLQVCNAPVGQPLCGADDRCQVAL